MNALRPAGPADLKSDKRPDNREIENENLRPGKPGEPPRPATEPPGSEWSQRSRKTVTDPGSGKHKG